MDDEDVNSWNLLFIFDTQFTLYIRNERIIKLAREIYCKPYK